ncbi:MAG: hypothetical protein K0R67_1103, partial [Paenibacillus sp.]|nr:hypothetical protein [Paenibacillus sp.]
EVVVGTPIIQLRLSFSLAGALGVSFAFGEPVGVDVFGSSLLPHALRTSAEAIDNAIICFNRLFNYVTSLKSISIVCLVKKTA